MRFICWVSGYISLDMTKSRLFLVHIHSIYELMSFIYLILFILCVKGSILIWIFLYSKPLFFTVLPFLPPLTFCSSFLCNVNHTSLKNRQAFVLYFLAHAVPVVQCCSIILYIVLIHGPVDLGYFLKSSMQLFFFKFQMYFTKLLQMNTLLSV
jgi:hypothetical protein